MAMMKKDNQSDATQWSLV